MIKLINKDKNFYLSGFCSVFYDLNKPGKMRGYSTSSEDNSLGNLNPNFVTGLADAECSFLIILTKRPESRTG